MTVTPATASTPRFFASPAAFRKWLAANHAKKGEVLLGFHKVGTGKPGLTWTQSVEEALCHGWIDGVRRSLGPEAYTIRFTPRKPGSHWSAVNVRHALRLIEEGRMGPAGKSAFEARTAKRTAQASYEQGDIAFTPAQMNSFKADKAAWTFFSRQAPTYRKAVVWWVVSAKRPETSERRLAQAVACSAKGVRLPQYSWRPRA